LKLPITKQEAERQWQEFEEYLVTERYSVRDPDTGKPFEANYNAVLQRVAGCFKNESVRQALASRKIITATPFLMNGGNNLTNRSGYYSCYPLGDVGDSTDSIFEMERNLATVFQHAGGGGIDVSNLRKKGAPVDNGQGNASGPVSFAKGYSHLSSRISQGGKRRGALMIQMDDTHPDIKEFVSFKGDDPGKYNGCNVSVNVTSGQFWENEDLIDWIAEYMWKGGDPGLLFTKRSMENTPVPSNLTPIWSNPCGEFLCIKNTACNLLSVNLQACTNERYSLHEFYIQVMDAAKLAAIAGNEILDMGGFPPIPEIKEETRKHRPIGVGFTGLHAAMVDFGIDYRYVAAVQFAKNVQACIMIGSMEGSKQYGEDYKLDIRPWDKLYQQSLFMKCGNSQLPQVIWQRGNRVLPYMRNQGGLYNCVTTSQAPTGSTSQLLHVSSTGIEPYFSMIQKRKIRTADGGRKDFTLVPLEFYDYDEEKLDWIAKQTAHHINPEQQIKILEAVQTFCHTGVSKTINMPASATVADIKAIIMRAKDSNLKGLTVFRDSSMEGVLSDGSETTNEISGSEEKYPTEDIDESLKKLCEGNETVTFKLPPSKPRRFGDIPNRKGVTYKFSGPSSLYITANFGDKGDVMEIFIEWCRLGCNMMTSCGSG
jgi:ribonucleoside-diphosphate reductase alpha chain